MQPKRRKRNAQMTDVQNSQSQYARRLYKHDLSNDSQKITKVVIICVMLAVYGFTMIMLGSFTLIAREDASKIPNCFETIGSPFTHPIQNTTEQLLAEVDPIQNTPEPLLAQVAWCFGIVFCLIGGVTLIGTLCYACMRAFCFPP